MNAFRYLLLSAICLGYGCDSPKTKTAHAENNEFLRPDVFLSSPGKVEGCVGLYTYDSLTIPFDSLDVDQGKKVLATKSNEFAFFRLHRKDIYLRYDSAKSGPVDKKTFKEVYRGNDYTVVLITHSVREEGEAVWLTGTLEVIFKDKHFTIKIKGLSGC
ncbi:MAG TPA: hypothetical protein VG101_04675 [Puia sp.]|jgi:hypothetical protein|nr:hypothetical protein [Puia sp.]